LVLAAACGSDDAADTPAADSKADTKTEAEAEVSGDASGTQDEYPTPTPAGEAKAAPEKADAPKEIGIQGGALSAINYAYPEVWDPHLAGTLGALGSISAMYNQVVEFDPISPGEVIGDLAKSWEVSDDALTYTFTLHEGVEWADGQPLTSEDVVWSINRMIDPDEPRPRVGLLRPAVDYVEAIDDLTFKIVLKFPSGSFLPFLAVDYMKIMPKHVIEQGIDVNIFENIVAGGPFVPDSTRRGESTTYTKNPNYFKEGRPFIDEFNMFAFNDAGTAVAAFKSGQIQMQTAVSTMQVDDLLRLEEELADTHRIYWQPSNTGQHFFGNTEEPRFSDPRVISAIRIATDLHELQQAFGEGRYGIGSPFPPGAWYALTMDEILDKPGFGGVPGSSRTKQEDIDYATALLADAGYDPPSELGTIELTVGTTFILPDAAQIFKEQMKNNLGVDIEIKLVDVPTQVNAMTSGDYQMSVWGYGVNIFDPGDWVNAIYGDGVRNYTRYWNDAKLQGYIDAQAAEQDQAERTSILREAQEYLMDGEVDPYITYLWIAFSYIVDNRVRTEAGDWVPSQTIQTMLKYEHVWWDPDYKD